FGDRGAIENKTMSDFLRDRADNGSAGLGFCRVAVSVVGLRSYLANPTYELFRPLAYPRAFRLSQRTERAVIRLPGAAKDAKKKTAFRGGFLTVSTISARR
ncbi:MAG: hypothetical protein ACFN9G_11370, partial [Cardiobacterium sp.]